MGPVASARLARFAPNGDMAAHAHSSAVLGVVLGGAYRERTRGRESEHRPGDLLFCPADEPHAQSFSPHGAVKLLLWLDPAVLERMPGQARLREAPFIRSERATPLARRLVGELQAGDDCAAMVVDGLALEIAGLFCRGLAADDGEAPAWLRRARDYLHAHVGEGCALADVAAAVGRDPAALSRGFRRAFGASVGDYARRVRLEQACEMLARSRAPLSEIALDCGFCDQAHMSRSFKAAYGVSPRRWRAGR